MDCRRNRTDDPDRWITTGPPRTGRICEGLRELILRWEPDLTESVNSNMLCFSQRKRVCALGAFKDHAEICFYRGAELPDPARLLNRGAENMSIRGIKLATLDGLDCGALRALLHAAVKLDGQPALPPPPKVKREPWPMPEALAKALKKHGAAAAFFDSLKPTYQREYKVWISIAKRPETLEKRLQETLRALAAGKKWAQRREA